VTETECPGCGLVLPGQPDALNTPTSGLPPHAGRSTLSARAGVRRSGLPPRPSANRRRLCRPTSGRARAALDPVPRPPPGHACLVLEDGADPADGPELHRRLAKRPEFGWLEPPERIGELTVRTCELRATPQRTSGSFAAGHARSGAPESPTTPPFAAGSTAASEIASARPVRLRSSFELLLGTWSEGADRGQRARSGRSGSGPPGRRSPRGSGAVLVPARRGGPDQARPRRHALSGVVAARRERRVEGVDEGAAPDAFRD
jgi:hypothetical protein